MGSEEWKLSKVKGRPDKPESQVTLETVRHRSNVSVGNKGKNNYASCVANSQTPFFKRCSRCKVLKEANMFTGNKQTADGLAYYCKPCRTQIRNKEHDALFRKKHREKRNKAHALYKKLNPQIDRALRAKRRAKQKAATPKWLAKQDFKQIEKWYTIAKELQWLSEEPLHVDHIIPLQGKEVCGLHVPWNLQILTISENLKKRNK